MGGGRSLNDHLITLLILVWIKKRAKGAFKYYVSAFGGGGVLSQNADTADAAEGGRGYLIKF